MTRVAACSVVALLAASCGGGAAAEPAPAVRETVIGAHRPAGKTLAELRVEFLSSCTGKVPDAPDYCACAWEQMANTFSEEEMNAATEDKAKLVLLKDRIETICESKLRAPR